MPLLVLNCEYMKATKKQAYTVGKHTNQTKEKGPFCIQTSKFHFNAARSAAGKSISDRLCHHTVQMLLLATAKMGLHFHQQADHIDRFRSKH